MRRAHSLALLLALILALVGTGVRADDAMRAQLEASLAHDDGRALLEHAVSPQSEGDAWADAEFAFESYRDKLGDPATRDDFDSRFAQTFYEWLAQQAPGPATPLCDLRAEVQTHQAQFFASARGADRDWSIPLATEVVAGEFLRRSAVQCGASTEALPELVNAIVESNRRAEAMGVVSGALVHANSFAISFLREVGRPRESEEAKIALRPLLLNAERYAAGPGGSILGAYAVGALLADWGTVDDELRQSLRQLESRASGEFVFLPYDFASGMYGQSRRGGVARNVVFQWAMLQVDAQDADAALAARRAKLESALSEYLRYLPHLLLVSLTSNGHSGSDGLAHYFLSPSLFQALRAARYLEGDEGDSVQTLLRVARIALPAARVRELLPTRRGLQNSYYDVPLIGLALLEEIPAEETSR